ncbi:Hypothetical protein ETEE_1043 [Edwardsiella anguillarum ET080813]|uniref:Uncharacterized protein n=1 Tax=Edwardsiella anguillarum ET080813 TaxID=667120 RepID=A0A076LLE0_9GAMM|nr:Hypothetical protein ETEE_1043 [Edwardsiella anguillarum ET080813]
MFPLGERGAYYGQRPAASTLFHRKTIIRTYFILCDDFPANFLV